MTIEQAIEDFFKNLRRIGEYKTGYVPWTQKRVDESGQLTFYAYVYWLRYQRTPRRIALHWLDTSNGAVQTFETKRTVGDFAKLRSRINLAWAGIQKMCKEEVAKVT